LEKYKVNVFYTAPTAIRMLMKSDGNLIKKYNLSNLRHLCSVGEALNPEAIRWGIKNFGLPFHDTWWQTETGAMMICNLPSEDIILGSMGKPLPGIKPLIVDEKGKKLADNIEGDLTIEIGWPSMMVKAWGKNDLTNHEIDLDIGYIANGLYYTGDKAKRDKNGNFYFISRADDVIKTSGERVGPFEVESALMEHKAIGEAAVIGKPDKLRGEIIKAFCILKPGFKPSEELKSDITEFVKKKLAGHAYPREIEFVNSLPKTRSGKIMRRILKAKELGLPTGDLSTLEE
jgi:acetyl-CoA synthetase